MRPVRPTLRVLRDLPLDTYGSPQHAYLVSRNRWDDLRIYDLEHPLLKDAGDRFAGGLPDAHQESSRTAKAKVYEVRSRGGAAWRGAVMLDDQGDPWLVYVNRHDHFHSQAALNLTAVKRDTYMPREVDYKLRAREEAATAEGEWQVSLLESVVSVIRQATETESGNGSAEVQLPLKPEMMGQYTLRVQLEHDPPSESAETAHQSSSAVSLQFCLSPGAETNPLYRIVQVLVPFLKVQDSAIDPVFDRSGQLCIEAILTQAKLIQLVASGDQEAAMAKIATMPPPAHLHYVGAKYLSAAFVYGKEVRAVCGEWFVPTRDEGSETSLPICRVCEEDKPKAQYVLDLIRRGNS